ncbi:MAG: OB-fold nucleic acid binding domain-containing protein [Promethearchaeota archaeon]
MSFKRNPTIQCWIKHIIEGQYDESEKFFHTIFGQVKRIRIIGTIVNKSEKLIELSETDMEIEEDVNANIRIDFDLDDSTGMIRATIRNVDPENFLKYKKGDIVEVTGRVSKYGEYISLWIEIIQKVQEPNLILLRNAEIIDTIKHGKLHEIPDIGDFSDTFEDFSDEIDVRALFESDNDSDEHSELKKKVYGIIEENSSKGKSINFKNLKEKIKISDNELRSILNDLILESRIYESDNDNYEAF